MAAITAARYKICLVLMPRADIAEFIYSSPKPQAVNICLKAVPTSARLWARNKTQLKVNRTNIKLCRSSLSAGARADVFASPRSFFAAFLKIVSIPTATPAASPHRTNVQLAPGV